MAAASVVRRSSELSAGDQAAIAHLIGDALSLFDKDKGSARRRLEQAYSLASNVGDVDPPARGALTAWQARKMEVYVDEHLGASLRVEAAAAVVRLSASYFSRAFKATFGLPFSHYVVRRRVELAKRLLLSTNEPIAVIALTCGLADQSHLTRLFSRAVGCPPNAWRRRVRDPSIGLQPAA